METEPEVDLTGLIARRLRAYREGRGVPAARIIEVAQELGLSWNPPTVAAIEKGARKLKLGEWFLLPSILLMAGVTREGEAFGVQDLLPDPKNPNDPDNAVRVRLAHGVTAPGSRLRELLQDPRQVQPLMELDTHHFRSLRDRLEDPQFVERFNKLTRRQREVERQAKALWPIATEQDITALLAHRVQDADRKAARTLDVSSDLVRIAAQGLWGRSLTAERERRLDAVDGGDARTLQAKRGHITRHLTRELRAKLDLASRETDAAEEKGT